MGRTVILPDNPHVGDVVAVINVGPEQWMIQGNATMASENQEQVRFRSFAERYLVTRSHAFTKGNEEAEAWECGLQARTIYEMLNGLATKYATPEAQPEQATPAKPSQPWHGHTTRHRSGGSVGPSGPSIPPGTVVDSQMHALIQQYKSAVRNGAPKNLIHQMEDALSDLIAQQKAANQLPKQPSIHDSKGWTG